MAKYLIAHDLGTSGNKASLFSTDGVLVNSHTEAYDVHFYNNNWAEQNPEDWWNAVKVATHKVMEGIAPADVLAMSFSAQMQACVVVDAEGTPLRQAMIWADMRAQEQADRLEAKLGFDKIYDLTGHRVSPSYSIEKLMWIKDNEPEIYNATYKMLLAKDYVICKMTGEFVTDHSEASGTNALDLENLCWSKEILEAAEIDMDKMPELHKSIDIIGKIKPSIAEMLGVSENIAIVCGGGDGPCSALGAGCTEVGQMFLSLGTSAFIGGSTPKKFTDPDKVVFCFAHVIPDQYMPCGTMQSAGSSYVYIKDALCQEEVKLAKELGTSPYELMNKLLDESPVGAKGLLFLPYLLGERSPRWNPDTSGSFLGIKMQHEKCDYVRSVLEGVAMNLDLIMAAYRKQMDIDELILTGGGAKGDTYMQILADVMNATLHRLNHVDIATSIAAAMIAGVGVGVFEDFSEISKFIQVEHDVVPIPENQAVYAKQKPIFDKAYSCLEPLFVDMKQE